MARRRQLADEGGFTLVEVLVALVILAIVALGLGVVFVSSLTTVAQAKQRQAATGLATQGLEQLRALPYAMVTSGLNAADLAGDANLQGSPPRLVLTSQGINEPLVTYTAATSPAPVQPPLYPHRTTQTVNGITYTVSTYVTTRSGTTQASYNLTVAVTWTGRGSDSAHTTVQRSATYSPSSCLSTATHPFSGPCQAFFSGQAGLTGAGISVTNADDSALPIPGFGGTSLQLGLPVLSTSLGIEQVGKLTGTVQGSSAEQLIGTTQVSSGGAPVAVSADTDPSSTGALSQTASTPGQVASPLSLTGSAGQLTAVPTTADTGGLAAMMVAGSGQCVDEAGTTQNTGQPCVSGNQTRAGSAGSIQLSLAAPSGALPTFALAQISGTVPARAVVGRYTAPGGGGQCPTTSGVGCVSAGASRELGPVDVGGLPAAAGLPAGYTYSFRVSGVRERAYAEIGWERLLHARAPSITRSAGTLEYWNGAGYSSLNLAGLGADATVSTAPVSAAYLVGADQVVITIDSQVTAGAAGAAATSPVVPSDPYCVLASCWASATGSSTVRGETTYTVTVNGTQTTRFVVVTDLGSLLARASYQAAPSG